MRLRAPRWCARAVNLRHVDDADQGRRGAILRGYRDQVLGVLDTFDPTAQRPVVVVGHSMGAQVGELVAAARPDTVVGMALIAPIPLAGYALTLGRRRASIRQHTTAMPTPQRRVGAHC